MIKVAPRTDETATLLRISVVVPVRNGGAHLYECLDSILGQRGVAVDVTVVDDASTDYSVRLVADYARRDPRVRLVTHDEPKGRIATLNEAMAGATASLLVVAESDATLTPGALERAARLMDDFPELAFAYGDSRDAASETAGAVVHERRSTIWTGSEWIAHVLRHGDSGMRTSAVMIRRECLEAVGGQRHDVPDASNLNHWLRLASVGSVGRISGPAQAVCPATGPEWPFASGEEHLSALHARLKAFELFVDECQTSLHDPTSVRTAVRHCLARDARRAAVRARDQWRTDVEPVSEYLAFARSLEGRTAGSDPVSVAARTLHDLQDRLTWRRWRRVGI